MEQRIAAIEQRLGYRFGDRMLALTAMAHKSYVNEAPQTVPGDNERLEFLGDAVLDLVVSQQLFAWEPPLAEGEMTRVRAEVVSEKSLAAIARRLGLGELLLLGRGEELTGGRDKESLLADALEALIGAVFCDRGFAESARVVLALLGESLGQAAVRKSGLDSKTRLQEYLQSCHGRGPSYQLLETSGPDHDRRYLVGVRFDDQTIGTGSGRTKKRAEQAAAADALRKLQV